MSEAPAIQLDYAQPRKAASPCVPRVACFFVAVPCVIVLVLSVGFVVMSAVMRTSRPPSWFRDASADGIELGTASAAAVALVGLAFLSPRHRPRLTRVLALSAGVVLVAKQIVYLVWFLWPQWFSRQTMFFEGGKSFAMRGLPLNAAFGVLLLIISAVGANRRNLQRGIGAWVIVVGVILCQPLVDGGKAYFTSHKSNSFGQELIAYNNQDFRPHDWIEIVCNLIEPYLGPLAMVAGVATLLNCMPWRTLLIAACAGLATASLLQGIFIVSGAAQIVWLFHDATLKTLSIVSGMSAVAVNAIVDPLTIVAFACVAIRIAVLGDEAGLGVSSAAVNADDPTHD